MEDGTAMFSKLQAMVDQYNENTGLQGEKLCYSGMKIVIGVTLIVKLILQRKQRIKR